MTIDSYRPILHYRRLGGFLFFLFGLFFELVSIGPTSPCAAIIVHRTQESLVSFGGSFSFHPCFMLCLSGYMS